MARMAGAVEIAAAAGASIVALPMGSRRAEDWTAFAAAAEAHPEMLFVVSAGNDGRRPRRCAALSREPRPKERGRRDLGRRLRAPGAGVQLGARKASTSWYRRSRSR